MHSLDLCSVSPLRSKTTPVFLQTKCRITALPELQKPLPGMMKLFAVYSLLQNVTDNKRRGWIHGRGYGCNKKTSTSQCKSHLWGEIGNSASEHFLFQGSQSVGYIWSLEMSLIYQREKEGCLFWTVWCTMQQNTMNTSPSPIPFQNPLYHLESFYLKEKSSAYGHEHVAIPLDCLKTASLGTHPQTKIKRDYFFYMDNI